MCKETCHETAGEENYFRFEGYEPTNSYAYCVAECSEQEKEVGASSTLYRNYVDYRCVLRHNCPSTARNAVDTIGNCIDNCPSDPTETWSYFRENDPFPHYICVESCEVEDVSLYSVENGIVRLCVHASECRANASDVGLDYFGDSY